MLRLAPGPASVPCGRVVTGVFPPGTHRNPHTSDVEGKLQTTVTRYAETGHGKRATGLPAIRQARSLRSLGSNRRPSAWEAPREGPIPTESVDPERLPVRLPEGRRELACWVHRIRRTSVRGYFSEELVAPLPVPPDRPVVPVLPLPHRALVDAEPLGQLSLSEPEKPPGEPEPSREVVLRFGLRQREGSRDSILSRVGHVAQELDDRRHVLDGWRGPAAFPVRDRIRVNPDRRSYLPLLELQSCSASPQVISERLRRRLEKPPRAPEREVAKRQRRGVRAACCARERAVAAAPMAGSARTGSG